MRSSRITRLAIAGIGAAGLLAVGAGTAFAAPPPAGTTPAPPNGGNVGMSVTVEAAQIQLTMNTTSMTLSAYPGNGPGIAAPVSYSVLNQEDNGYTMFLQVADLTSTKTSEVLPADDFADAWTYSGSNPNSVANGSGVPADSGVVHPAEGDAFTPVYEQTQNVSTDSIAESWTLSLPGNFSGGTASYPFTGSAGYIATAN